MTFSENVTTLTREYVVPDLFSQVNLSSPLAVNVMSEGIEWTTGTKYELPIKYALSTNGGLTGIADQLDSNRQDNRTKLSFEPKSYYKPVVVASIEQHLNKGDERVLELLTTEMHSQMQDLMEGWSDQVYAGTGAGNSWNSIATAADDGTNYGTYGTLSRTTYTSLAGYYLASAGSLTLGKLATAYDATEKGTDSATGIFTTKTLWAAYEALLTPTVNAQYSAVGNQMASVTPDGIVMAKDGLSGTQGFRALTYRGTPVMKDEHCPSGKIYFVNSRKNGAFRNFGLAAIDMSSESMFGKVNFSMNACDPQGTFGTRKAPKGFSFREMMMPVDQRATVGYLFMDGEICSAEPRLQGQMTGATA
jgi:hypothetical protein